PTIGAPGASVPVHERALPPGSPDVIRGKGPYCVEIVSLRQRVVPAPPRRAEGPRGGAPVTRIAGATSRIHALGIILLEVEACGEGDAEEPQRDPRDDTLRRASPHGNLPLTATRQPSGPNEICPWTGSPLAPRKNIVAPAASPRAPSPRPTRAKS